MHRVFVLIASLLMVIHVSVTASAEEWAPKARIFQGHQGSVMCLAFSPDQAMLATSSRDKTIKLWDVKTGELKQTLTGHTLDVYCVTFSRDGKLLVSASGDKSIRIWDLQSLKVIRTLEGHTDIVRW